MVEIYSLSRFVTRNMDKEFDRVDGAYKKKKDKVRPTERWISERELERKRAMPRLPNGKYPAWLIPKFSRMTRGARLTAERLQKILVGERLSVEEKDLLTEVLNSREAALGTFQDGVGPTRGCTSSGNPYGRA